MYWKKEICIDECMLVLLIFGTTLLKETKNENDFLGNVCAEFNKGGEFVQEHYTTPVNCSRCPFMYASSDANQCKFDYLL